MPIVMLQLAKETRKRPSIFPMLNQNCSWKAVHVTPIGEQCVQHADYVNNL